MASSVIDYLGSGFKLISADGSTPEVAVDQAGQLLQDNIQLLGEVFDTSNLSLLEVKRPIKDYLKDTQITTLLDGYYTKLNTYSQLEVDTFLSDHYLKAETYTKAEVDVFINDRYTKSQVDALIAVGMSGADIKIAYEGEPNTNGFTDSEQAKLASIDATHYGSPLQTLIQLRALPEAGLTDKERRYVEDQIADYFYDETAISGDEAPDDQTGGTGFWRKTAVGGETPASIKTKYESNADTNAFNDAAQLKLSGIEANATADQTDLEIETAYNNQVALMTQAEAEAGTATTVRRISSLRISQAIAAQAGAAKTAFALQFGHLNIIQGQTVNIKLTGSQLDSYTAGNGGSILRCELTTLNARTSGILTAKPTVNGVPVIVSGHAESKLGQVNGENKVIVGGAINFLGGDEIGVQIVADGIWSPTTPVVVILVIQEN